VIYTVAEEVATTNTASWRKTGRRGAPSWQEVTLKQAKLMKDRKEEMNDEK